MRPQLDFVFPLVLHARAHAFDEDAEHFFFVMAAAFLFQLLPVLFHALVEVSGGYEVSGLPGVEEEGGLEAGEVLGEGGVALALFLQHQPHHHQLVVEILGWTHHLYLLALLQTNLVHL